ncbi:MAG: hydroxymethylbilane synthase [Acidobacteriota bacterium]|nr:hydroxymethylbilane synthase [Acidobacteriota bacterium]
MKNKLIIGSRGSRLALWQTNFVKEKLEKLFRDKQFEVLIIKTTGDKLLDVALAKIGDKGLFTKQIETALLENEIDLAVHSLKDLQTEQPENLKIGAVSKREKPNDVLISTKYSSIDDLPHGAKVATGSLRRISQILNYRKDLKIFEIRGNVPTRIKKFEESDLDAMILAYAGVHRLELDSYIKQIIPFEIMLPAVGQGAMAVEIRSNDTEIQKVLQKINDQETLDCVTAERSFLRRLEGGCQVPIAGFAQLQNEEIHLRGMVGNLDGSVNLQDEISGDRKDAADLGNILAERLIEKGANNLLEQTRETVENTKENVI